MGNCDSRKFPPDGSSTYWRHCGAYNDWVTNDNFCTPLFGNNSNDSKFCNGVGGEGEWKLRTPAHQQSQSAFIVGGGNSVQALQDVIPSTGDTLEKIKSSGSELFSSNQIKDMRKATRGKFVNTSDNRDMGPLFGPNETGSDVIPLWTNWLSTYSNNEFPKCTYNDWRKNGVQTSGCCSSHYLSCGIMDGMNVTCLRNEFSANNDEFGSISCCFNDLVCEPGMSTSDALFSPVGQDGEQTLFSTNNKCFRSNSSDDMRTCKPESRNLGGNFCRDMITPYCTGDKLFPGQAKWQDAWDINSIINVNESDIYKNQERPVNVKGPCAQLLMRQLSGLSACGQNFNQYQINAGQVNLDGMLWAKEVIQKVFTNYIEEYGSPILGVNEDGIEAAVGVNNFLYNICQKFPALCTESLTDMCSSVTEERIAANPIANKWCGCYMPESQYEKYSAGSFLVSKQCTPFCSRNDVIPLVDSNYAPLFCEENICIMNDIYLDFVKSQGAVNFNEVCNNCGKSNTSEVFNGSAGSTNTSSASTAAKYSSRSTFNSYSNTSSSQIAKSCQCKLDNINLEVLNSKFSNINFATQCGGAQCTNSSGEAIACSSSSGNEQGLPNINTNISNIKNIKELKVFKKIFILVLIVIVLIILYYLLFGNKKKEFIDSAGKIFSLNTNQSFTVDKGFIEINK